MPPRFDQINLVVGDMDAMADFYRRLGVDLDASDPEWAPHHRSKPLGDGVHIDLDSEQFAQVWDGGWRGGTGIVLGFRVGDRDDVDRLYSEFTAAGYLGQQPPYDAFWGARYAIICDPDGNAVGLMSESEPGQRRPPPNPPFDNT